MTLPPPKNSYITKQKVPAEKSKSSFGRCSNVVLSIDK